MTKAYNPVKSNNPMVSVVMATYNGAALIEQSIDSILSQTYHDFEFIIVDDCSTDNTREIIAAYQDSRLRVISNETNLGVAAARNRAFSAVRGPYIALIDHDDLSFPTRLAKQVAHLQAHPTTVALGTASETLRFGQIDRASRIPERCDAVQIDWLLHLVNPLVQSSMMLRTAAVRRLAAFMRPEFKYADDFDLYHRLKRLGAIERLDECLTLYRLHGENASYRFEDTMIANAAKVLAFELQPWFADHSADAAMLISTLVSAQKPAADLATLERLGDYLLRLLDAFRQDRNPSPEACAAIARSAGLVWWQVVRQTACDGRPDALLAHARNARLAAYYRPSAWDRLICLPKAAISTARRTLMPGKGRAPPKPAVAPAAPVDSLFGATAFPAGLDRNRPPTLFVVVDTEAEFDWNKPFDRDQTGVANLSAQFKAQAIFDRYGLRPAYLIDYPVASQKQGYEVLREFLARDCCEVGVHLHPWTTPPFEEILCERNSYPGNLPAELEERKLTALLTTIKRTLGVQPIYYKAGRNGLGPNSLGIMARLGLTVDMSLLPATDRTPEGGPDSSRFEPTGYRILGAEILEMPTTRAFFGPLTRWKTSLVPLLASPLGRKLRLAGILSRLSLLSLVTLTPEGMTTADLIALINALLKRGHRYFVMYYHSSSLRPGSTPYVRDQAELDLLLRRLDAICRFFFESVGGLPGHFRCLTPPNLRPQPARTVRYVDKTDHNDSVSVIIAAYNAESTIEETLLSCLEQSRRALEIIVVSDGSSDATCEIVQKYAPYVRLIKKAQGGPSSARNLAARHASGEWLACLDADDVWGPHKLERQLARAASPDIGVIHCLSNTSPAHVPDLLSFDDLWLRNWIVHSTTLIRRTAFDAVGGYDESLGMAEDYNLWLRLAVAGYNIKTTQESLVFYRKNHGLTKNIESLYRWEVKNILQISESCGFSTEKTNDRIILLNKHYGLAALHERKMSMARDIFVESYNLSPDLRNILLLVLAYVPPFVIDIKRRISTIR